MTEYKNSQLSKKEEAYLQLKNDIISHRLKPGQPITEDEVAHKFLLSRTPVREIFRKLENDGLVKNIAFKGTYVTDIKLEDIEEILDIRYALEGFAARMAAKKVDSKGIKAFSEIAAQLEKIAKKKDSVASFNADTKLHDLILTTAGNERVHNIISNLLAQIHRIRFISGHMPGRINTTIKEHLEIIRAIKKKDPDLAEEKMHIHIANTRKLFLQSSEMEEKLKTQPF